MRNWTYRCAALAIVVFALSAPVGASAGGFSAERKMDLGFMKDLEQDGDGRETLRQRSGEITVGGARYEIQAFGNNNFRVYNVFKNGRLVFSRGAKSWIKMGDISVDVVSHDKGGVFFLVVEDSAAVHLLGTGKDGRWRDFADFDFISAHSPDRPRFSAVSVKGGDIVIRSVNYCGLGGDCYTWENRLSWNESGRVDIRTKVLEKRSGRA